MSKRAANRLFIAFLIGYTLSTTYPGALIGNRIDPLVLGLPFSMVWVVLWVVIGLIVLLALGRAYTDDDADDRIDAHDRIAERSDGGMAKHPGGPFDRSHARIDPERRA